MEDGESPLEVLSRAATMVQENQNSISATDESSKLNGNKQLPTTKWKRDRRTRNEYSRKSDPKLPENFGQLQQQQQQDSGGSSPSPSPPGSGANSNSSSPTQNGQRTPPGDAPLDMTVRQRGQPPSYSQTVNNPGYRSSYRQTVVTPQNNTARDDLPTGISMCDPIIDEHFRRSLGKDYVAIFSNNNVKDTPAKATSPTTPKTATTVIELMDTTGLSVDDHFAKALGDTWLKLKKKEPEIKANGNEGGAQSVVAVSYS